uniref:Uncharacterized protein n=1 Tax=Rhodnius prolixus TaxID=13249 RepID=T1HCE3_RHOPR
MKILECLQWTAFFLTAASTTAFASLACVTSPCIYGICMETLNGSSYTCYCIDGYTGTNCQTNWDECWSSPCLNGGTCLDGVAYFNCTCPDGFVGETCEENVDECGSNPCLNNGTCLDIANGYTCQCQPGYSGFNCEVDMAVCNTTEETRCANGGACIEGPGISFSCRCLPGFTGINCETQVELCSVNTCENNALCVIEGRQSICYCVPDYHGERCQFRYDECLKGPGCLNGGNCIDGVDSYTCSCPPRLTGRFCECLVTESGNLNCNYIRPEVPNITTMETSRYYPSTSISYLTTYTTKEIGDLSTTEAITEVPIDYTTIDQISKSTITEGSLSTAEITAQTYTTDTTAEITESYTFQSTTETGRLATSTIRSDSTEISTAKEEPTSEYGYSDTSGELTEKSTTYLLPTTDFSEKATTKTGIDITTASVEIPSEFSTMYITSKELTTYGYTPTLSSQAPSFSTLPQSTEGWPHKTTASTEGFGSTELMTFGTPTDTYGSSSSTEIIPDCIKQPCENGGSCVNTTHGAKCQCKFGWTGKFCEKEEGIKIAAFKGRSYLLHIFGNSSTITVSLKMRTLAENGIILYAHASANIYMSLYLQQGFLKFQFSCGIQTMLFSELKYSINTGFLMDITATLELLPQNGLLKKCNGSVKLNGTLSMSGKQETLNPTVGMKMSGVLYLGGLSTQVAHQVDIPYKEGITACMHDLRVNEKTRKIYGDAFDGIDVSECESLACLSSPCQNSATCIEIGQKWNCLCPSGFLGDMCERSVCLNNPCKYGGTCVIYPGSGFMCLCPLGKHGMFCDQDLEIGHPHFSSSVNGLSSYTAYPLPGAIHHSFELHFRFVPSSLDQIALMIFIGQSHPHDSSSDHLAVSFIKGYVVLTWNLGSGPRRIFTPQAIIDSGQGKQTHNVRLGRSGQIGWLQVDSMPNVTGISPGWLSQLNTRPIIYVGGHESRNFSGLPHDLPLHSGYSGCLYDLELRAGKVRLSIQRSRDAVGRNVGQCSTKHCHNSTCLHRGACIDHGATFTCLCQDGWFGAGCEIRYNPCESTRNNCSHGSTCVPLPMGYECDCPLGKTGRYCQLDETLSDVGFSGHRSFLSLAPASLELTETCIDLEIRPVFSRGLILYSSQSHALSTMFISLSLHGGVLEFRIQPIGKSIAKLGMKKI